MIWLSGAIRQILDIEPRWDVGVMCGPRSTHRPQAQAIADKGIAWAADK